MFPLAIALTLAAAGQTPGVEQTASGARPPATLVESFDGLGAGFQGPQGTANFRNPSDNSLAVGPDHVVQTVNSRMAIFTKKGARFDATGRALYGPVETNNVFRGFGGQCEARNNGDAVVRYDQLANRWLIVMPIFARGPARPDQPPAWQPGPRAYLSPPGRPDQPRRLRPQPGTDRRLDAQGDKIMARLVYRRVGTRESIVAVHSVNTAAGGGGVRWYEFGVDTKRNITLRQQGTYAPDGSYRWMASPAIDRFGNIGIGYSFGGTPHSSASASPPGSRTIRRASCR